MEALITGLAALPLAARRSIAAQSSPLGRTHLQAGLRVQNWLCDPQSPWQKGTVGNTNGRLRRCLSRQIDPAALTNPDP